MKNPRLKAGLLPLALKDEPVKGTHAQLEESHLVQRASRAQTLAPNKIGFQRLSTASSTRHDTALHRSGAEATVTPCAPVIRELKLRFLIALSRPYYLLIRPFREPRQTDNNNKHSLRWKVCNSQSGPAGLGHGQRHESWKWPRVCFRLDATSFCKEPGLRGAGSMGQLTS